MKIPTRKLPRRNKRLQSGAQKYSREAAANRHRSASLQQRKTSNTELLHVGGESSDRQIPPRQAGSGARGERLQKLLADRGLGSRREIERWISEGRIQVNGDVAKPGLRVVASDRIELDGESLAPKKYVRSRVLLYHKPVGQICSRDDPKDRLTIFTDLPPLKDSRWISIGRLDFNTSGLLLLTTDGQFANRMMHPSSQIEREYLCRVRGRIDLESLKKLHQGVKLDGQLARFHSIHGVHKTRSGGQQGSNQWYQVVLREGRYREVRRMWQKVDCTVSRLIRIRYGTLILPKTLAPGNFLELSADAIEALNTQRLVP